MSKWLQSITGDLCDSGVLAIGDGYRAKNDELSTTGLPFARAGNINDGFHFQDCDCFPEQNLKRVGNKISRPGDVVFTSKGTVGRFAFVREDTRRFVYSPQLCFWRSLNHELIHPRFLYYWMQGEEFGDQADSLKCQTDMADYVSLRDQRSMKITLPPLNEQTAIAEVLGIIDDKIELNRQMNRTLEETARALYRSWFVDFDPVVAKAAGRPPAHLSPALAALFPDSFQDSDLGPIPKGWRVGRLDEVLMLQRGFDLPAGSRTAGPYPIIAASGLNGTHHEFKVEGPGVTTGRSGVLGKVYYVEEDFWPLNTSLWIKEYLLGSPLHAYHLLQGMEIETYNAGSAVPTLNRNHVHNLPVVIPPPALVQAFEAQARPLFQMRHHNQAESQTLAALRDTLLPKLLSGEVRVKTLESSL